MIDERGYRLNVGIIITNERGQLLWCRRIGRRDAWQFPQGGIDENESPEQAMFRELAEELGLMPEDVECLSQVNDWLVYHLPKHFRRYRSLPLCIGQKQKWFLLRLKSSEDRVCFDRCEEPEFDNWRWVDYWYPLDHVIDFKRSVYKQALHEFEPVVLSLKEQSSNKPTDRTEQQ